MVYSSSVCSISYDSVNIFFSVSNGMAHTRTCTHWQTDKFVHVFSISLLLLLVGVINLFRGPRRASKNILRIISDFMWTRTRTDGHTHTHTHMWRHKVSLAVRLCSRSKNLFLSLSLAHCFCLSFNRFLILISNFFAADLLLHESHAHTRT